MNLKSIASVAFIVAALFASSTDDANADPGNPNKQWERCYGGEAADNLVCVWNAKNTQYGNGEGRSFINKYGKVTYISHIRARYLLADK